MAPIECSPSAETTASARETKSCQRDAFELQLAPMIERFVGRSSELRKFDALLADIAACGRGRLVLVTGEPGIGKTRLAEEVTRRAVGWQCAWGRSWEGPGTPAPSVPTSRETGSAGYLCTEGRRMESRSCRNPTPTVDMMALLPRRRAA